VPVRVSPTVRIRHHIDELFAQDRPLPEILEEVARLGAQLLMQAALAVARPCTAARTALRSHQEQDSKGQGEPSMATRPPFSPAPHPDTSPLPQEVARSVTRPV
jgi:hypothetical protein